MPNSAELTADPTNSDPKQKVLGVGLNKTGTKSLMQYFEHWGYRHRTFELEAFNLYRVGKIEELLDSMEEYDSFEDWPWPLMYREIDERFPGTRFILTTRKSPEKWYRSLCNMAVRMGPLNLYEKHIYGYGMPQGHKEEHIHYYNRHNEEVREYFKDRPEQLLTLCWEDGNGPELLSGFMGLEMPVFKKSHLNKSPKVYSGDNLILAHLNRIVYQTYWYSCHYLKRAKARVKRLV